MLPHYHVPYKKTKQFRNQMSHHLRYFRFSNRTHIEMNEDLQMDQFFKEEEYTGGDNFERSRISAGPIRAYSNQDKPQKDANDISQNILLESGNIGSFDDEYV